MTDPATMCRRHLLGEHVEMHMFLGSIRRGFSMEGYLDGNLLEPRSLVDRHDLLVAEMERRGYRHRSPLILAPSDVRVLQALPPRVIDKVAADAELRRRCPECRGLEVGLP